MCKRVISIVTLVAVFAIGGCSGSDDEKSKDTVGVPRDPVVTEVVPNLAEAPQNLDDLVATLSSAGLTCDAPAPYDDKETEDAIGVDAVRVVQCEMEGQPISAVEYKDASDSARALSAIFDWACGAGALEVNYLAANSWVLNADADSPEAQVEAVARLGEILGVEAGHKTC